MGIGAGKLAIAKHVVIPHYRHEANAECLVDLDALLADEKLQIRQGHSAKGYATDGDFLLCTALISLVDDDLADPNQVRSWAMQIAFIDTIGLFDSLWILMGLGFTYIMLVFD